jgi:hypothetical protein
MGIEVKGPEVRAEDTVPRVAVLREHHVSANNGEYPTSSGPEKKNQSRVPRKE